MWCSTINSEKNSKNIDCPWRLKKKSFFQFQFWVRKVVDTFFLGSLLRRSARVWIPVIYTVTDSSLFRKGKEQHIIKKNVDAPKKPNIAARQSSSASFLLYTFLSLCFLFRPRLSFYLNFTFLLKNIQNIGCRKTVTLAITWPTFRFWQFEIFEIGACKDQFLMHIVL